MKQTAYMICGIIFFSSEEVGQHIKGALTAYEFDNEQRSSHTFEIITGELNAAKTIFITAGGFEIRLGLCDEGDLLLAI